MKILALVRSCRECPRKSYYSGGRSTCSAADAILPYGLGENDRPPWCPLADYPAAEMNRLMEENAALRRRLEDSERRRTPAEA